MHQSDVIVFYLFDLPTPNIFWEMNKVIELNKQNETIIIAEQHIMDELLRLDRFKKLNFNNIITYSFNSGFKTAFKNELKSMYQSWKKHASS